MEERKKLRLAVLVSGSGTNLQALMDASRDGTLDGEVVVVVSDRQQAFGLVRAERAGIPAHVVEYRAHIQSGGDALHVPGVDLDALDQRQRILRHDNRQARLERLASLVRAEQELVTLLDRYSPDYVCLAGYMRLVTPYFLEHFNRGGRPRVLNIHPALLPAFPGQHGYEDTFGYGCKWGGITVHFVDEGEDSGPIVAQAVFPIWPRDDAEAVRQRGLELEYMIYAQCLNWLAREQVEMENPSGSRPRAVITDPAYRDVIKSWMRKALG